MPNFKIYQDQENLDVDMGRGGKGVNMENRKILGEISTNLNLEEYRMKKESPTTVVKQKKNLSKEFLELTGCAVYRADIYKHLRGIEMRHRPKPFFMRRQESLTPDMRRILVDWIVDVCQEYELREEILHRAVYFVDKFLSSYGVVKNKLQLLGTTAIFLASKYEAVYPPTVADFSYITDNTYTEEQILNMECCLLSGLSFNLSLPTSYTFLSHIAFDAWLDHMTVHLAMYLLELALLQGDPYFLFLPSLLASAAIALSRYSVGATTWPDRLVESTGYTLAQLSPALEHLNRTHEKASEGPHQAVVRKYSTVAYSSVSTIVHIDLEVT
jgi:cyclin A